MFLCSWTKPVHSRFALCFWSFIPSIYFSLLSSQVSLIIHFVPTLALISSYLFVKINVTLKKSYLMPILSSSELICLLFLPPQSVEYFHSQILHAFSVICLNKAVDSSSVSPHFLFFLLPWVLVNFFNIFLSCFFLLFWVLSILLDMLSTSHLFFFVLK